MEPFFTKEQIELIKEQQVLWQSYNNRYDPDQFEDDMWYVMNRSGLFEEEQWGITQTRRYITNR